MAGRGAAPSASPSPLLAVCCMCGDYGLHRELFRCKIAGKGAAPLAQPSASSIKAVCCMCGDYGLHRELFRCKVCIARFQHKYCSNLFPKAEDYQACNWCLSDETRKPVAAAAVDSSSSTPSNKDINGSIGGSGVKSHRGAFPSHLSNPAEKPKKLIRSQSDVGLRESQEELSPGIRRGRQAMRGKVRRYKLLEELSS